MDLRQLHAAALQRGVTMQGLDQVTAKALAHFGDAQVKPADLDAYLSGLPVWDKLGMSQDTFYTMPAAWRMDMGRSFQPPPVHSRRPVYRTLSAAELETLEGLPLHERQTRARAMQQTAAPEQP